MNERQAKDSLNKLTELELSTPKNKTNLIGYIRREIARYKRYLKSLRKEKLSNINNISKQDKQL